MVLAMHSYGGLPSSEAAKGLAKTERETEGEKKSGVVRLFYICAALLDVGTAMHDPARMRNQEGRATIDVSFFFGGGPHPPSLPTRLAPPIFSSAPSSLPSSSSPLPASHPQHRSMREPVSLLLSHPRPPAHHFRFGTPRATASPRCARRTTSTTTCPLPRPSTGPAN